MSWVKLFTDWSGYIKALSIQIVSLNEVVSQKLSWDKYSIEEIFSWHQFLNIISSFFLLVELRLYLKIEFDIE